jgi:hypothetical protein
LITYIIYPSIICVQGGPEYEVFFQRWYILGIYSVLAGTQGQSLRRLRRVCVVGRGVGFPGVVPPPPSPQKKERKKGRKKNKERKNDRKKERRNERTN